MTRAYRTSPSSSLCVLANEPCLYLRRKKLSMQYCLKVSATSQNPYDNFEHIYTDGSKMGDRVASAAVCSNMVRSTRLPNNASIFSVELYTITLAMYFIRRSRNSNFVVYPGSMSSLEALNGFKFELDLNICILNYWVIHPFV